MLLITPVKVCALHICYILWDIIFVSNDKIDFFLNPL